MSVEAFPFGQTLDGEPVTSYTLRNSSGMTAVLLDYGAALQALCVPNRQGGFTDVVLGFDNMSGYLNQNAYLGATIGRMANRIGGAEFSLNGKVYRLSPNDGANHLHGGQRGFDKLLWQTEILENAVCFSRVSPDGEEGYPGNLSVRVTYTLTEDNALNIDFQTSSDQDTIVSLTNHSYFNLNGSGDVLDQLLQINSDRYLELTCGVLPTGRSLPVAGSPFDFRRLKPIGQDIAAPDSQIALGSGYDHCFLLSGSPAAIAQSSRTGIELRCFTDLPGLQLYTSNCLDSYIGKGGIPMCRHSAFCLEAELFPNAINLCGFPSPLLKAGETQQHHICYRFTTI